MIGEYTVMDDGGRELSCSASWKAAQVAVRVHLSCDGEDPPLHIYGPDGKKIGTGVLDDCGRVVIRTSTLNRAYEFESEVISKWGRPQ